jgi:hypothetical protein
VDKESSVVFEGGAGEVVDAASGIANRLNCRAWKGDKKVRRKKRGCNALGFMGYPYLIQGSRGSVLLNHPHRISQITVR